MGPSAAQEAGVTPPLPSRSPASSPQRPELVPSRSSLEHKGQGAGPGRGARTGRLGSYSTVRGKSPGTEGQEPPGLGQDCLLSGQGVGGGSAESIPPF